MRPEHEQQGRERIVRESLDDFDKLDLGLVAMTIARVIARKHIESEPRLRKMDGLGKVTATVQTMAEGMWPELAEEAEAAAREVLAQLSALRRQ